MFFDATKETMLSIEMHDGFNLNMFHQRQKALVEDIKQLLKKYKLQDLYRIDLTTIATDVESPKVGKALGANRFLQFLKKINSKPQKFETFGDSKSDFEMSDELHKRKKKVKLDNLSLPCVQRLFVCCFFLGGGGTSQWRVQIRRKVQKAK